MLTFLCLESRVQQATKTELRKAGASQIGEQAMFPSDPVLGCNNFRVELSACKAMRDAEVLSPQTQKLSPRSLPASLLPSASCPPLRLSQVLYTELESSKQQLANQGAEAC